MRQCERRFSLGGSMCVCRVGVLSDTVIVERVHNTIFSFTPSCSSLLCLNTHNKLCKYGMLVLREVEEHLLCGCTRPPLQPSLLPPEVTPYLMQSMPPCGTWRITHAGEECSKCLTAFKVPSACKGERGASPCKTEKLFDE